ncbi:hypothetical protein BCR44DRAFT_1446096 [Catenaria anguillulae PL171]|uniref:Uncharacterized protein n=1 Tax=Catenaria anguillulae PL171 TaxID=765915 RepID=A0A1Y2HAT6_9FUNG|nr:hypothetical protein BCR44DRAFT_1446096 [Catenaria anguillulae PL171]
MCKRGRTVLGSVLRGQQGRWMPVLRPPQLPQTYAPHVLHIWPAAQCRATIHTGRARTRCWWALWLAPRPRAA